MATINNLPSLNALIVSNDEKVRNRIQQSFDKESQTTFFIADSSKNALDLLRGGDIDVMVADVDISDLDGWRLSRLIRSGILNCRANIPILIITSTWSERIAEVTAREYGVNQILPVNNVDIVGAIMSRLMTQENGPPKTRLLVVEDQQDTSDLIKRVLGNNFDIEVADDGEKGLNAWRAGRHALVLLDVMLPKCSGQDVLKAILSERPNQVVVIMTAHASIDQAEELMMMGAADFLPKPFRPDQLRKVCNIAERREDYLVSNAEMAARALSLEKGKIEYRRLYESHHQLLDELQTIVMKLDQSLNITYLNRAWETLFSFNLAQCMGKHIEEFLIDDEHEKFSLIEKKLHHVILSVGASCQLELCFQDKFKERIWAQLRVSGPTATDIEPTLTICLDNITEQKKAKTQLEHLAAHDSLTGLYNRYYFESALEKLSQDAELHGNKHGLIYMDLDHFKIINDTFGHQRGDEILREMSKLLCNQTRNEDFLCRIGGDEFAVLLKEVNELELKQFALRLHEIIVECSFELQNQRVNLGSSMGLTMIDGSLKKSEQYLGQADIALYVAKGRGRNIVHLYDSSDSESEEMRKSINWSQKIKDAIQDDRLVLYFQPIYDIALKDVSYYEALVRLIDNEGSVIGPGSFIPALEKTGEMKVLDRHIIDLATRNLRDNPQLHHIAVNLSAQAFKDENLLPVIVKCLTNTSVSATRLTFELTESASLFNLAATQRVIHGLHKLGCKFSVDDFGSGFSSFSYLKQLPADHIKIDGSLIKDLQNDKIDQSLTEAIIRVIQSLRKKAVAEYVENKDILDILETMGVDLVQGYYIGFPLPISKISNDSRVAICDHMNTQQEANSG